MNTNKLNHGDTFTHNGLTFRVLFERDEVDAAPWDNEDGHGPVSEWMRRDKLPGERVLHEDRGVRRFYDFAGAMRIAKRDGWGLSGEDVAKLRAKLGREPTKGDIRAEAVEHDFDRLRRWCSDDWYYIGVVVELLDVEGEPTGENTSVWGVESDADEYLDECTHELAEQLCDDVGKRKWLVRKHGARHERIRIRP